MLGSSSLGGCQDKLLKDGFVYKFDRMGYESISEALVSEFESYICNFEYLDYFLDTLDGTPCCKSKYMVKDCEKLYSLYDIIFSVDEDRYLDSLKGVDLKNYVVSRIHDITGLNIEDYLARVIYLDCITMNSDRHLGNISLIKSNRVYREAPVFDNGLSLLSDLSLYSLDRRYTKYMNDVRSRPFSSNFAVQRKMFKCSPLMVNIDGFMEKLDLVEKNKADVIPFKVDCYDRAVRVILKRLNDLKDDVWVVM